MTQKEMVKYYLNKYGSITAMEGFNDLGIVDLASVIRTLRNEGYEITDKWLHKTNRFGNPVSFKKYMLPKTSFFQKLNRTFK